MRGVVSEQSRCTVHSQLGISAFSLARSMSITRSNDVVPAMANAAPLDLSPASQTERASMTRFVQVSNE